MPKRIALLFLFCIGIFPLWAQPSFYVGFINGTNPIKMRLEVQPVYSYSDGESFHKGYDLVGDYQYVKVGEKIKLEGKNSFIKPGRINTDSVVKIYEYVFAECRGYFMGKFSRDGSFRGTWHSIDGIRVYPFAVELSQNAKIVYKESNDFYYPQIKGLLKKSVERSVNKSLTNYKSGFSINEEVNGFLKCKYHFEILYNENNVLTLLRNEEWYSDTTSDAYLIGTSGNFSSINLLTGNKLQYEEILSKGSEYRIDEYITEEIVELCDNYPDKLLLQEIRSNICVTQLGLLFYYPGCPSQEKNNVDWAVEIPFRKIKKLINPHGLIKVP